LLLPVVNFSFSVCQIFHYLLCLTYSHHCNLFSTPVSFGTENDVLDSLPNNTIKKGRWMPEEHKIFIEEYEKYGNNCMLIAKVLNT
jgi:hypothetical protein